MNDRFVTFVAAVLDPASHSLTVVNAGHMPPLLRPASGGPTQELGASQGSPPLGIDPVSIFRPVVFQIAPGDIVVIYTDGISEARNPAGDPYGVARVLDRVGQGPAHVEGLAVDLLADVERFRAGRAPADDVCLVALARDQHEAIHS
jgi:serine phosphatase RsbU (regulator of sigma subunit)